MYGQSPCASAQGHFCSLNSLIFSLQFFLHFKKKAFWCAQEENTWTPPFIFLPPYPTKHTLKKFSFPFFSLKEQCMKKAHVQVHKGISVL